MAKQIQFKVNAAKEVVTTAIQRCVTENLPQDLTYSAVFCAAPAEVHAVLSDVAAGHSDIPGGRVAGRGILREYYGETPGGRRWYVRVPLAFPVKS